MKVILVNGSPNENGCTYTALREVADTLIKEGIGADIFQIGKAPIGGCIACGACHKIGKCVFDDRVNEFTAIAADYDGFVFGAPVHFASAGGSMSAFLDRVFFSRDHVNDPFALKPAGIVTSARRAGTTAALDRLAKYPLISQMPLVASQYWCMVHGNTPDEVRQDEEGMQIMRTLGRNMAWILKLIEIGAHIDLLVVIQFQFA